MPGALASWAHDTSAPGEPWTCSRGSSRNSTMPWTPEIRRSRASAVAAGGGTDPTATLPPGLAGLPCTTTNPSSARPASSGSTRQARSEPGVTRRLTPSGEMFTRRSASRAARAVAAGTPDRDREDVGQAEGQLGGEERLPGERDGRQRYPQHEEQPETDDDTGRRGHRGLYGRDHRGLPGRRADQPHRGEPLLAAGRGQAGGRADEDQHRHQQRQSHHRQDQVDARRREASPDHAGAMNAAAARRSGVEAGQLRGARQVRHLRSRTPDDDDQRVGGRQARLADQARMVPGVTVRQLVRRGTAQ